MIDGAIPISIMISPPNTATALHARPGSHAFDPWTRIASAIAIAYAITSNDPQPLAYTTHAVLIAATAARRCRPHIGRSRPSIAMTSALEMLHATSNPNEEPERRLRDEMRALQPGDREDRRGSGREDEKGCPNDLPGAVILLTECVSGRSAVNLTGG